MAQVKIISGLLAKNEEHRWLKEVCKILKEISDVFIVLDDASTDNTANICEKYANIVWRESKSLWETNELILRKKLFNMCMEASDSEDNWILIIDADEIICDYEKVRDAMLLKSKEFLRVDVFTFLLFDMWSDTHYRDDKYWYAHKHYWPMAFRAKKKDYTWNEQSLHCGRFPNNIGSIGVNTPFKIKHMGWSISEDRQKKHERYMRIDPVGKHGILEQYLSILDKNPRLVKFDD